MVCITFFGKAQKKVTKKPGLRVRIPLVALAILSVIGGFLTVPDFLQSALPSLSQTSGSATSEGTLEIIAGLTSVVGIYFAYLLFLRYRRLADRAAETPLGKVLHHYWFSGWGFDWLYDTLLVRPYVGIARLNRSDAIELVYQAIAGLHRAFYFALSATETGHVRWYAKAVALGAVVAVALMVFL
jgi:NADH-quinone oxidoreductase subunit L